MVAVQAVDIAVRVIMLVAHTFEVCTHTLKVLAQGENFKAQGVIFSRNVVLSDVRAPQTWLSHCSSAWQREASLLRTPAI